MLDGHLMAGTVVRCSGDGDRYEIRRVDGGMCLVPARWLNEASPIDILEACAFFTRIGTPAADPKPINTVRRLHKTLIRNA
jgi:hypothetical protein